MKIQPAKDIFARQKLLLSSISYKSKKNVFSCPSPKLVKAGFY